MLYITVGNTLWWCFLGSAVCIGILINCILIKKSFEQKRKFFLVVTIGIFVLFYLQRILMFNEEQFAQLWGTEADTIILQLLPLQLCYLTSVLLLIGLLWRNETLLAFCFYVGSLGAVLAIVSPDSYYTDINLLEVPSAILFYFLHGMIAVVYFSVGTTGLITPGWKKGLTSTALLGVFYTIIHVINMVGKAMGLEAINYFYSLDTGGSGALDMFWNLIPYPFWYLLMPGALVVLVWTTLISGVYKVVQKGCRKR